MFSPLIIIYLFLAGTGCGTFVVAVFLSWRSRSSCELARVLGDASLPVLGLSCGLVVVGAGCLLLDLGRPELALEVLENPAGSVLSIGAWSLAVFVAFVSALIACRLRVVRFSRLALRSVEALGCVSAVVVMVYSGLFLSTIWTLPFLASPLVPALFVVSSLSCGIGVVFVLPFACDVSAGALFCVLSRVDGVLLAIEALLVALLVALSFADPLSAPAAVRLVSGDMSLAFWGGLAVAGIALPFALEVCLRRPDARMAALTGALLLVGGLCLRYCLCTVPFTGVVSYLSC